jgi:hypothetical protein
MLIRIISPKLIFSPRKLVPVFLILIGFVSGCMPAPRSTPGISTEESPQTAVSTPDSQELETTPAQTSVSEAMEFFLRDQLGLCFFYPQGYTQIPYYDAVEIVAPDLPGSEVKGLFWFDIRDPNNLTAEEIADNELAEVAGLSADRWSMTIGGEQAVVLDGMPGQDLVRRVYFVHEQTLYILTFSPTLSENTAASDQMEALYDAVTSTWEWSPCSP